MYVLFELFKDRQITRTESKIQPARQVLDVFAQQLRTCCVIGGRSQTFPLAHAGLICCNSHCTTTPGSSAYICNANHEHVGVHTLCLSTKRQVFNLWMVPDPGKRYIRLKVSINYKRSAPRMFY